MNKLNVLAKNMDTYFLKRLTEEVGHDGLNVINPWIKTNLIFEGDLWVRTTAVYGSDDDLDFCRSWKGKIINPLESLERFRSKSSQYAYYEQESIPHLPWLDLKKISWADLEIRVKAFETKLLIKPDRGQGGWGIRTLGPSELKEWWKGSDHDFLLQPYIETKKEFRYFFIVGDRPIVLERSGELAANFTQGGVGRLSVLPTKSMGILDEVAQKSGALYGAIDCFVINDQLTVLELNTCPGIEQLEKISGLNLTQKLLRILSP